MDFPASEMVAQLPEQLGKLLFLLNMFSICQQPKEQDEILLACAHILNLTKLLLPIEPVQDVRKIKRESIQITQP